MTDSLSRRNWLIGTGAAATCALAVAGSKGVSAAQASAQSEAGDASPFSFCFNTSTIRGQKRPIVEEIEMVGKAGYDGIEPWIGEINRYVEEGGKLPDLKKRIQDAGLRVESAIGFANWIVDDDQKRAKGLEDAKRDMELVRAIGGTRIAAPPAGATKEPGLNLFKAAERYHALLDVGRAVGVLPQLELWGFSQNLSRLGELVFVAAEAGHPDACMLPDVYHIYKGGSDFAGLKIIDGASISCFHMNDYPADPPRDKISDADRVYPGDGVAPLNQILTDLYRTGFRGPLSLELFNRDYWKQDPAQVVTTGLAKMKAAVAKCDFS